jgi:hypothetical protein
VPATLVALALLAWATYAVRRASIRTFFVDGVPSSSRALVPDAGEAMTTVARTRVVLVDGLSRAHAKTLPGLDAICDAGLELGVDTGFPTVSLPVQHALWTGLTQQESGVQYRIGRIDPPPADAMPLQAPGSVAVAESHREIVHSFGFSRALPAMDDEAIEHADSTWRAQGFMAAALEAVRSSAPLVFVHILRVDEAGHQSGGASAAYADAAAHADRMVTSLFAAAPGDGATRWFVLADHGHRPGGGHGGAEDEIRVVRACITGGGVAAARHSTTIHLVDLHRAIAASLGLPRRADAGGRTLAAALADPRPGATLPRPRGVDLGVAGLLLALAIAGTWRALGRASLVAVLWPALGLVGVLAVHGAITLSNPVVYPPLGGAVLLAGIPGFVVLGVAVVRTPRTAARLVGWMLPALGGWAATGWACRLPHALLGGPPPLLPTITAYNSVLATLLAGGFATAAVVMLVGVALRRGA